MVVMCYQDQKVLEGKRIPRDVLGLAELEAASQFAAAIRAVEIERCFHGAVSTMVGYLRLSNYTVGWVVCGVFVAFSRGYEEREAQSTRPRSRPSRKVFRIEKACMLTILARNLFWM